MHGVSEVIAIILILMITIGLTGIAYVFTSDMFSSTASAASSSASSTTSGMMTQFVLESFDINKLYIRNTGQTTLSNLSVYMNDLPAHYNISPETIPPGQVAAITIYDISSGTIKVSAPQGFSVTKDVPDQCNGAVACWHFDEGTGSIAYDSSGSGNHGTIINMAGTATSGWTSGRFGNALNFDGIDDIVNVTDSPLLNFGTGDFSFSYWFKASNLTNNMQLLGKWLWSGTHDAGFHMRYTTSEGLFFSIGNGTSTSLIAWSFYPQKDVWYHIVAMRAGNTGRLYVNGALNASITNSVIASYDLSVARPLYIGSGSARWFNGTMDEVALWNRALSQDEITALYNKGLY